jgi:hypothetical protein
MPSDGGKNKLGKEAAKRSENILDESQAKLQSISFTYSRLFDRRIPAMRRITANP